MQPIWWCVVTIENLLPTYMGCYRILLAEKTTVDEIQELYAKYVLFLNQHPRSQIMLFYREPEETPFSEKEAQDVHH